MKSIGAIITVHIIMKKSLVFHGVGNQWRKKLRMFIILTAGTIMKTIKNCKCNLKIRDEESSLTLTTHHPTCKYFNPANELKGLEDQCKHFLKENLKLKRIIKDLKEKIESLEEEVDLDEE